MEQHTLFIADLHLSPHAPEVGDQFLAFLKERAPSADVLYILGDLFDVWIGDDDDTPFIQAVKSGLMGLAATGTPLFLIHGNRDFLIGKRFCRDTGVTLLPDPTKIDLYGRPVLLMHGDTLCQEDEKYLRARKILRNRLVQTLFKALPLSFRKSIAKKMRSASQRHTAQVDANLMDVSHDAVSEILTKMNALHIIHGHTHRPKQHHFTHDGKEATRTVLGAWESGANALSCDSAGQVRFIEF